MELETAIGDALGADERQPAFLEPPRANRELLDRLLDDLTFLVQTPEARYSKRNHNAFVDALKRLDYVRLEAPDEADA